MDKLFEAKYHELEESHWWFQARRDMIVQLLRGFDKDVSILDVGCSGGALIQFLKKKGYSHIVGIDASEEAIARCREKGLLETFARKAQSLQLDHKPFDVIIASDILEHIQDDAHALAEWSRFLKPKGVLIVFVPAFAFLWSGHDAANHHYRRYTKKILIPLLKKENFVVQHSSYWNFFLFFPTAIVRLLLRLRPQLGQKSEDQLHRVNPFLNTALTLWLKCENRLLRWMNFPFGVSLFAVAYKNE